ncbi:hypothetical protein G5V58_10015 [Nocardioides anomalus]|uniref:TY-Chap N-terminal domain-containing protein n=1 Tax=Nocardioides anomalus TaxID=2712223 RepID=A0A6G6WCV4_9ACTN|nr:hypothetical protein [Nocardioides anomalus]QIG43049.1 hypothetical protein G5V58_10015 [Nocardioides anomalus]
MRGTWDDVNRRLVGALLALDLHDALVLRAHAEAKRGLFRKAPEPRRYAQVTAARTVLIAEVWPVTGDQRAALLRAGWEEPWQDGDTALSRQTSLAGAPQLALAVVRALQALGTEVADVDVALVREEPDD